MGLPFGGVPQAATNAARAFAMSAALIEPDSGAQPGSVGDLELQDAHAAIEQMRRNRPL
jgi:hypothetical protein